MMPISELEVLEGCAAMRATSCRNRNFGTLTSLSRFSDNTSKSRCAIVMNTFEYLHEAKRGIYDQYSQVDAQVLSQLVGRGIVIRRSGSGDC